MRVRAFGSGTGYAAAWSAPSAPLAASTGTCTPPVFAPASYTFSLGVDAPIGTVVGTVAATDDSGEPVTYGIQAGRPISCSPSTRPAAN